MKILWVHAALLLIAMPARAQDRQESAHGRIDGDLDVAAGAGVSLGPTSPRAAFEARVRYLETAGLFVTYEDGSAFGANPDRVFSAGIELRPLFLGRWLKGSEFGVGEADLIVDSFALELGGTLAQTRGSRVFDSGMQAGLGLEIPMGAHASGVWIGLHGGVRFDAAALQGSPISGPEDRALFLNITLAWHQVLAVHIVDVGDALAQ